MIYKYMTVQFLLHNNKTYCQHKMTLTTFSELRFPLGMLRKHSAATYFFWQEEDKSSNWKVSCSHYISSRDGTSKSHKQVQMWIR